MMMDRRKNRGKPRRRPTLIKLCRVMFQRNGNVKKKKCFDRIQNRSKIVHELIFKSGIRKNETNIRCKRNKNKPQ